MPLFIRKRQCGARRSLQARQIGCMGAKGVPVKSKKRSASPGKSAGVVPKASMLFEQALALHQSGKPDDADVIYRQILAKDPKHSDSLHLSGMAAYGRGDIPRALDLIGAAVALQPKADIYLSNYGNVLRAAGRPDEAMDTYRRAIAANPRNPTAYSNIGNAYSDLGKLDEAVASYEKSLLLKPDFYESLFNLSLTLRALCRFDEAIACLKRAISFHPKNPEAHYTLAQLLLLHGDLAEGWEEYDWRWVLDEYRWLKDIHGEFHQPRWQGESLVGKTLLVYAEQGMGDSLQFCRYLPKIVEQGGQVVFAVHPRLMRVIGPMNGVRLVPLDGVPLPHFDYHSPLLSLPRVMGTLRVEDIPGETPYLKAEPERVARWRSRLDAIPGFKIGIAWQGNPNAKIDKGRSPPLAAFAPLAAIPGVTLISLQQRDGLDQLAQLPPTIKIHTLGPGVDDEAAFIDTSAVMECLDLLILSDSAIVHLAGALRRPVWVPLKLVPDWRFLLEREDTPWYPEMRLFRQAQDGDWVGVFERMADTLRQQVGAVSAVSPAPTLAPVPSTTSALAPTHRPAESWGKAVTGVITRTDQGVFATDLEDQMVGRALRETGVYGLEEIALASRFLAKKDKVLVVGAHVGAVVIALARACAQVVTFEANPDTYRLLACNLILNDIKNVVAHNLAASDKSERLRFVLSRHNSGGSKRYPLHADPMYFYDKPAVTEVQAVALDACLSERNFALVFMDIEGSEYFALQGMKQILGSAKVLFVEFIPHHLRNVAGVTPEQFCETIAPHFDVLYVPGLKATVERENFAVMLRRMYDINLAQEQIVFLKRDMLARLTGV